MNPHVGQRSHAGVAGKLAPQDQLDQLRLFRSFSSAVFEQGFSTRPLNKGLGRGK